MIFWGNEKTGKSPYRKSLVTGSKEKRVYQKAYFSAMCHRGHRSETDRSQRVVPFQPRWLPGKVYWGPPTIRVAWGRKEEVGMIQHLWKQCTKPVGFHILSYGPLDVLQKRQTHRRAHPSESERLHEWVFQILQLTTTAPCSTISTHGPLPKDVLSTIHRQEGLQDQSSTPLIRKWRILAMKDLPSKILMPKKCHCHWADHLLG